MDLEFFVPTKNPQRELSNAKGECEFFGGFGVVLGVLVERRWVVVTVRELKFDGSPAYN